MYVCILFTTKTIQCWYNIGTVVRCRPVSSWRQKLRSYRLNILPLPFLTCSFYSDVFFFGVLAVIDNRNEGSNSKRFFFFFKWFIYFEEITERKGETEIFHLLVYPPDDCSGWDWSWSKPGARSFFGVSWWQGARYLDHLSQVHSQGVGLEVKQSAEEQVSVWDAVKVVALPFTSQHRPH